MHHDTNKKVCETCDNAHIIFLYYLCTRKIKLSTKCEIDLF